MRKLAVCILTMVWGMLMVQPAFGNYGSKLSAGTCSKIKVKKASCSKSKCSKSTPAEEKKECDTGRCNPLMSCPTGNFFVHYQTGFSFTLYIIEKEKKIIVNDNRISKRLSECWHPPEYLS